MAVQWPGLLPSVSLVFVLSCLPDEADAYRRSGPVYDVLAIVGFILLTAVFAVTLIDRVQRHGFAKGVVGPPGIIAISVLSTIVALMVGGYALLGVSGVVTALLLVVLALLQASRRF